MVQHRALRTGDGTHHDVLEITEDDEKEQIPLFGEFPIEDIDPRIDKMQPNGDIIDKLIENTIIANGKIPEKFFDNNNNDGSVPNANLVENKMDKKNK